MKPMPPPVRRTVLVVVLLAAAGLALPGASASNPCNEGVSTHGGLPPETVCVIVDPGNVYVPGPVAVEPGSVWVDNPLPEDPGTGDHHMISPGDSAVHVRTLYWRQTCLEVVTVRTEGTPLDEGKDTTWAGVCPGYTATTGDGQAGHVTWWGDEIGAEVKHHSDSDAYLDDIERLYESNVEDNLRTLVEDLDPGLRFAGTSSTFGGHPSADSVVDLLDGLADQAFSILRRIAPTVIISAEPPACISSGGCDRSFGARDVPARAPPGTKPEATAHPGVADRSRDDEPNPVSDVQGSLTRVSRQVHERPSLLGLVAAGGLGLLAGIRLYRRLTKDDLLDNDLRASMVEIVEEDPAIQSSDLADRLGVSLNTVLYHARILEEAGMMTTKRASGCVLLLPPDRSEAERRVLPVLRKGPKRAIVEVLMEEPGLSLAETARRLDRDRSTIKYHTDTLLAEGILQADTGGRAHRLEVSDDVRDVVVEIL